MERIDLAVVHSAARQQWRNGDPWDLSAAKIWVGELADGRWYVRRYHAEQVRWPRPGAIAYTGPRAEWYARGTARRWMRTIGGEWVEA